MSVATTRTKIPASRNTAPNQQATGQEIDTSALLHYLATISGLDPVFEALQQTAKRTIEISRDLRTNEKEFKALIERIMRLIGDISKRAALGGVDSEFVQVIAPINKVFEEIASYVRINANNTLVLGALNISKAREQIKRLNAKLDDATAAFQSFLLTRMVPNHRQLQVEAVPHRQGSRSGARHVPSDIPIVRLPPKPQIFFGRQGEVKGIVAALLEEQSPHLAILGPGGIGKTALGTTILHDARVSKKFSSNRLFISCDGITSADGIISVLASALKLLDEEDARVAVLGYFSLLRVPVLLFLDNFESPWDTADQVTVEDLLVEIAHISNLSLVVTMRGTSRPGGVSWSSPVLPALLPLQLVDARELFLTICPRDELDSDVDTLLALLDGLPLAITLMGYQSQKLSAKELIRAYEREKTGLLNRGRNRRLTSLEVSIEVSLQSLTMREHPEAAQALSLLSLLPDGIRAGTLQEAVPSLSNCREATRILVQVALVNNVNSVLRVLAPIRDFILHRFAPGGERLSELQRFFFQMTTRASEMGTLSFPDATKALVPQFGNIQAVLIYSWTVWPAVAPGLSVGQATLELADFSRMSSYGDCSGLLRRGIEAMKNRGQQRSTSENWSEISMRQNKRRIVLVPGAQTNPSLSTNLLAEEDRLLATQLLQLLGEVSHLKYRYNDAIVELTEARSMFEEIGNYLGAAQCLQSLGDTLAVLERHDEAVVHFTEARVVFEEVRYQLGVAQALQRLGDLYRLTNQHEDAVAHLTEAIAEYDAMDYQLGAAQCMQTLGDISRMQDRYEEAESQFTAAQAGFVATGDRLGSAQCTQSLGDVSRLQSRYEEAINRLTEARAAFDAIGERRGMAQCMQSLGDVSRMQHRCDVAVEQLTEARAAFDTIGDRRGGTYCLRSLGDVSILQRRYDEAAAQLTEAKAAFDAVGDQRGVAQTWHSLSDVSRAQGRNGDAEAQLIEARIVFDAIENRFGAAQCMQTLGDMCGTQNRLEEAASYLKDAQVAYAAVGELAGVARCIHALGEVARLQKRYEKAVEMITEARAEFTLLADQRSAAFCVQSLGEIARMQNMYDPAVTQLKEAKATFDAIGDRHSAAKCLRSLGEVARMQHRYTEAVDQLTTARVVFEESRDVLRIAECYEHLGYSYVAQGNAVAGSLSLGKALELYTQLERKVEIDICQKALDTVAQGSGSSVLGVP